MININNLTFSYGKEPLFSNLDLSIKPGSISGLLGKNGAGKTTLLKLITGLLFPDDGDMNVLGNVPSGRSPEFLKDIFFLPEQFRLHNLTPKQYVMLYAPFYPSFNHENFEKIIDDFDLGMDIKSNNFSHGQKKKMLIAFALSSGCRCILMDEPTNGLDIPSKTQFRKALASVSTEDNTVIISTHQVRDLESLIDPVIVLDEGKIILNRSIEDISNKLLITRQTEPPDQENTLFAEKTFDGFITVTENHNHDISHIDLEILFNAVINNSAGVSRIFQGGGIK